jgi:cell division protein ZapA
MKQLEVQIMGQSYLLSCPDGGDVPLLEAVERVDTAMCKIRDAGKVRARDRIAVLAALNLAFELSGRQITAPVASDSAPTPVSAAAQADEHQLLISLLERLDVALNEDGQLI